MQYKNIKINIPKYPRIILETLKANGYNAYIVGGCVRDELLQKNPSDFDITTNAKPNDIKKIFNKTIDTGIKHGTVSVLFYENNSPKIFEVTTYRIDGKYDDSRHPNEVHFVNDLKEDLRRRDFTVNAMAYNDDEGLNDEFNGFEDLKNGIIRAVGNPTERFTEDALRLLRAIRFAAKLGFKIENETEIAMPKLASNLSNISKERIQVELTKTITSKNPNYVKKIFDYGFAKYICDDFDKIKLGHFMLSSETHIAYTCLFYNTKCDIAKKILKCLKFDNNNIQKITLLLDAKKIYKEIKNIYNKRKKFENIDSEIKISVKKLVNFLNYDLTYDFIDILYVNNKNDKMLIDKILQIVKHLEETKTSIFISDLKIDGNDLKNIGFSGVEIGFMLSKILSLVYKNENFNQKKLLQDMAKKVYNIYSKKQ